MPYGTSYQLCPVTTETETDVQTCFALNGTGDSPVAVQTVLPDLSKFQVRFHVVF